MKNGFFFPPHNVVVVVNIVKLRLWAWNADTEPIFKC